jgi:hypothetical protein
VALAGVRALAELARDYNGRQLCMLARVIPAIVAALTAHGDAAEVAFFACKALANIAAYDAGEDTCVAAGAIPAIVAALRAHGSVAGVTEWASHALQNIGWSHHPAIVAAGAVPLLVAAAAAHGGEARDMARAALDSVGYTDGGHLKARGYAARMVKRMGEAVGDARVAEDSLEELGKLADDAVEREACVAAGAVPAIVAALLAHGDVAEVAQFACRALCLIALTEPAACVAAGAIPAIVAALEVHAGVAGVVQFASHALLNIGGKSPAPIVAAGAVPALAAAAEVHEGEARAKAREALGLLRG